MNAAVTMQHADDFPLVSALQAEVQTLRAEMQELIYTVSHDLRAPLRHITSYAQLVQAEAGSALNEELRGFLGTITQSTQRMSDMLEALAHLAHLGTIPLHMQSIALGGLVHEVRQELAYMHPTRSIDWHIANDLPSVHADALLLRQALTQVLGNAVKFTAPRDAAHIAIHAAPSNSAEHGVLLEIRDNGVGYNPALQAQLFKVFSRLHSPSEFAGLGMGLMFTQKIMQRMGGNVHIQAIAPHGCCVSLALAQAK